MAVGKDDLYALVLGELESALDPRELRRRGRDALFELAQDATSFATQRSPGSARVRVARPGGHRAGRTTVEILAADQPFIVDTVRLVLRRGGQRELMLAHPLLALERDADGSIARLGRESVGRTRESYVYAETHLPDEPGACERLAGELEAALDDARHVVADHAPMLAQLREHVARIESCAAVLPGGAERVRGLAEILRWLESEGFLFMGHRRYATRRETDGWRVALEPDSALGILRDADDSRFAEPDADAPVPALIASRLDDERVIFFDKTRSDSRVHRRGRLDSVSVKILDADARVLGFARFVGLLTNRAMRMRPSALAVLATRRARVLETLRAEPGSHTYKLALEAYDCLPLEFLLPAQHEDVSRLVARTVAAAELGRTEVASVADPANRSFFVTVALPRRTYEERFRAEIDELLERRHGASQIDHRSSFLDEDLALVHFFCASDDELAPDTLSSLEDEVRARVEPWEARFESALAGTTSAENAFRLAETYADAFPEAYRVVTSPAEAVLDVGHLERLRSGESRVELGLDFATAYGDARTHRLKLYLRERPFLTDVLPVVDRFGVRVVDATLTECAVPGERPLWIVSFRIEPMAPAEGAAGDVEARVLDGLRAALSGRVEGDDLNRLVRSAGLDWRSVDVLRAYLEYARQIGQAPTGTLASDALVRHPEATRALVSLFRARFDPDLPVSRERALETCARALAEARSPIASAAEDRVFGLLESLVASTLRTSFFVPGVEGAPHELALKLDSRRIPGLLAPVPKVEIFVHSPELVGIHLRGGPVARGGLRWSDRRTDLRTEILSLWKTQRVKNGLIVPVGAKGGFALKRAPADAREARAEADRLYARFVSALLRLTDDVRGDRVVGPERVVRHDGDDPYLVVAADKGTAHLSDVANGVAQAAGFWLSDAFASGGSNGYDHKRCAITARGAWICAQRHFAELGRDPERDAFTVAGIGDMSGDVFGNGLLLMRRAKLVAAFDHRHVFLDPDPDPELSWQERKRLFELPRSSWADYARERISAGGGVFERGAKRIELSAQVRALLAIARRGALRRGADPRDPLRARRSALERRHRHVREELGRAARGRGRPRERRRARRRARRARADRRRRRESRADAGGARRARAPGRAHRHRRDPQLGRRRSLGSRGQLQDPALEARRRGLALRVEPERSPARVRGRSRRGRARAQPEQSLCLSLDALRAREAPSRIAEATEFLVRHAELDAVVENLPDRAGNAGARRERRNRRGLDATRARDPARLHEAPDQALARALGASRSRSARTAPVVVLSGAPARSAPERARESPAAP